MTILTQSDNAKAHTSKRTHMYIFLYEVVNARHMIRLTILAMINRNRSLIEFRRITRDTTSKLIAFSDWEHF